MFDDPLFNDDPPLNEPFNYLPHGDIPMFDDDDPLFNDDPLNEPFEDLPHGEPMFDDDNPLFNDDGSFEDVPFARSPVRNKSPLQDEISIHHPLINGVYTVIIPCAPMLMMRHARTTL
jgi:hypothetical protein